MVNLDGKQIGATLIQCDRVDDGIEAAIVGTQGVEDLPHDFKASVVVERLRWRLSQRHRYRQNDASVVLALRLAYNATDRLDNIDHRVARVEENH